MKSISDHQLKTLSKFLIIFCVLITSLLMINSVQADGVNFYVRPGGDDANCDGLANVDYAAGLTACAKQTIQAAIDVAGINDIVNIAAGTYPEDLDVNKEVSLIGAGVSQVTIDLAGSSGHNNAGIYVTADNVSLQGFTLAGDAPLTPPSYGIKFADVSGGSLSDLLVRDMHRSGYDLLGTSETTISNIESRDNGGHGLALTDCNNITLTGYTAMGNGWQSISIATWGRYTPLGTSGIVLNAPFTMDNILQLEEGDYNNPGVPPSGEAIITYSSNPADGADVTFSASDFGFALHNEQDDSPDQARILFFENLADAQLVASMVPIGHLTGNEMFIENLADPSQLYVCPECDIQAAIDAASDGSTIHVDPAIYTGTMDIAGFIGLTITGADPATVIIQPTSLLSTGTCGPVSGRTAAVKVFNSTDVVIENLTLDMDLVKANYAHALFFCDSEGTVQNNIIKNLSLPDASGGYVEIGSDFRGPGYSDAAPAQVTITGNTFIDTGRLGIVTHEFVDATITNNTFYKTTADFGYAIEIGGASRGTIQDNLIYGFNTPALSDGSESGGIYIEPAWTTGLSGITKNVLVERNEIYDCQYGMWIGNGYDGFAGDVDIVVTLNDNYIHDNTDGGAWIQDEDQENGSSVTVTGSGNTLQNNGTYGYYIYTEGDGDITIDLTGETISGHDIGVGVLDTTGGTGTSSYDVSINQSEITGNSSYGVSTSGPVVDATENWWGTACGPGGEGPGVGNDVTTNVLYSPWWTDSAGSSSATEGASGDIIVPAGATTAEFQAILNCAASGTVVTLESGTYDGGLQANSPGITIDLNGCTVGEGSPAFTINAADVTLLGPGTLDGYTGSANSLDPAVLVSSGGDNFTLKDVEVQRWEDGVEVEVSVVSFKLIGNWIHSNTDAGLQVNTGVIISGITTIEGNLFKANTGNGIQNDSGNNLVAEYNSWGHISGASAGDGVSGGVDPDPFTYSEIFIDVEPDTQALIRSVEEGTSFDVAIKADAVNLYGLTYRFTYDASMLTHNSTTFSSPWAGRCFEVDPPQPVGTIFFRCNLFVEPEWTATGGTIATFNFIVEDNGGLTGNGPWSAYFDIDPLETSSAALGGIKVYVNNAGFNAPSVTDRDITNAAPPYDGQINITGVTQFTGFIDLQGTFNDSGGLLTVYDQAPKLGSTAFAQATSNAGGGYTTAYLAPYQLAVGTTYWVYADAPLYLPTTAVSVDDFAHSASPADRPFTSLNTLVLLGGDGTDDDIIGILDLTCIGASYQSTSTCTGGAGADADVNGDGVIDILDLVLMGGNYDLTASPWTSIP